MEKEQLWQEICLFLPLDAYLPASLARILSRAGIETTIALIESPSADLMRIRGVGKKKMAFVQSQLENIGLSLGMKVLGKI